MMEADELRPIVARFGGTRAFAARLKVSQRTVQYWLAGKRRIRAMVEGLIRQTDKDDNHQQGR